MSILLAASRAATSRWMRAAFPVVLALVLVPAAQAAPSVRPWMPAGMDSISVWASLARSGFHANRGDSLGGGNFIAYQYVGKMGRQLLRSLGRENLGQALAVEPVIDSLGLDTEVAVDPLATDFALMMVRNPYRPTADVTGFLYWYQGDDLRIEGVRFTSGHDLLTRVWHTGYPKKPYSWAVVENARFGPGPLKFTLLRLSESGYYWSTDQYSGHGIDPGGRGDAAFPDVNNDGIPELLTWTTAPEDSLFSECRECPHMIQERTWTEREDGFEASESRLMTSTYATFVLFIRLLREGNHAAASRLLAEPSRVTEAVAHGWDRGGGRGLWQILNAEPDENWPHWIVARFGRSPNAPSWVFHFIVRDGRWIIREWVREKLASAPPPPAPKVQVH